MPAPRSSPSSARSDQYRTSWWRAYTRPQHPYTRALLSAIPDVTTLGPAGRIRLTGDVPTPLDPPSGCRFRTRCWKAQDRCATETPALIRRDGGNQATACHYPETGPLADGRRPVDESAAG